jgi:Mrp family chromosome partitioning ATPase
MATREPTPQEQSRLDAIRQQWQQKRKITERFDKIKHKIAVYSGKGGVGKTTVSVNLATTLAAQGNRVGILDADIDCPNVVNAMKVELIPGYKDGEFTPAIQWGVKILSMGFFQENQDEAIIFRGPMIHNTLNQFMEGTDWGELDYLIVDMSPGTSDAALTIMQTLPLDGFVIVTGPQELAALDAKRSVNMVKKLNMAVIGVVENFSGEMFGTGAGEALAKDIDAPFLGKTELRPDYKDTSKPSVLISPAVKGEYEALVGKINDSLENLATVE